MYFRPTFEEFSKAAQAKKTQLENLRIAAENNHKSALDRLHDDFLAFANQMYPYFEETCKVGGQKDLYFTIDGPSTWYYEVTFYSDKRVEFVCSYQHDRFIILTYQAIHGQEGSVDVTEKLTTGDADIDRLAKYFQNPAFMGDVANRLLECIQ